MRQPISRRFYFTTICCRHYVALHWVLALANVVISLSCLDKMHYYHTVLGDLYEQNEQREAAQLPYQRPIKLTVFKAEEELLQQKHNLVHVAPQLKMPIFAP